MSNVIQFPTKNNSEQTFVTLGCGAIQDDDGTYTAMVTFSGLKSPVEAEEASERMLELIKFSLEDAGFDPINDIVTDFYQASYDICEPYDNDEPMFYVDDPLDPEA